MSLQKGIFSTFVSKVLVSALGLLMVVFLSRNLGAEGRGQIGLFMSTVALLQLFCDFGNSTVIINLSYTHNQFKLWLSSIVWVLLICIISYPILYFFNQIPYVLLVPPAAFLLSLTNLNHLILMGGQNLKLRNISILIFPALLIILFIIVYVYFIQSTDAYPIALFLALIFSATVSSVFSKRYLSERIKPFVFEKEILSKGVLVQSAQALQFLNYRLNFFLVAWMISESALGIYNNAVILCESIWILGHSIGQVQHMRILNSTNEQEEIRMSNKLLWINLSGSIVLSFILLLIPNAFWTALFSDDFVEMRTLFYYLIPGVLSFAISNIINHYLHAKNAFKTILLCNGLGLIAGTVSSIVLIPIYQLNGACIAWSIGLFTSMLVYIFSYKKMVKNISKIR